MTMLRAALHLAERGLWVFPCRPHDKRPATAHGVLDATTDSTVIETWWKQQPLFNIGVATGKASGIMVLDVDDLDAEGELRKLEVQNGALPSTVESITARGRHLLFKWPEIEVRNSAGRIAPGIDIRGNGGYIVAPPSIHPSGKRYHWSVDSGNCFAPAPDWLLSLIAAPAEDATPTPVEDWLNLIRDGAPEGCRNESLARITGHLLSRRVDPAITLELATAVNDRFRPPLSRKEVVAVVNSIAALEMKRRANL